MKGLKDNWNWLDFIWVFLLILTCIYPLVYTLSCFYSYLCGANLYDFSELRKYDLIYLTCHLGAIFILLIIVYGARLGIIAAIFWPLFPFVISYLLPQYYPNALFRTYLTRGDTFSYYFCHSISLLIVVYLVHCFVVFDIDTLLLHNIKSKMKKLFK